MLIVVCVYVHDSYEEKHLARKQAGCPNYATGLG